MPEPTIAATFLTFSIERIAQSERDIYACLDRLSGQQILYQPAPHENSIANLLLHLSGNIRQWILHGIDGQPNVRTRDAEFVTPNLPCAEIRQRFTATVAEARAVIAALPESRLLEITDPQPGGGWEVATILEAVYRVVGHLQLHTGQIILLAKQLTRTDLDLSIPRKR